jgi:hypothetical protein
LGDKRKRARVQSPDSSGNEEQVVVQRMSVRGRTLAFLLIYFSSN